MCCRGTNILFAKYPGGTATQLAARRYNEATALEGVTNAEENKDAFNSPETISAQSTWEGSVASSYGVSDYHAVPGGKQSTT